MSLKKTPIGLIVAGVLLFLLGYVLYYTGNDMEFEVGSVHFPGHFPVIGAVIASIGVILWLPSPATAWLLKHKEEWVQLTAERAQRKGDIEFASGNIEKAMKCYKKVGDLEKLRECDDLLNQQRSLQSQQVISSQQSASSPQQTTTPNPSASSPANTTIVIQNIQPESGPRNILIQDSVVTDTDLL